MEGAIIDSFASLPEADPRMVMLQPGLVVCHTTADDLGAIQAPKTFDGDNEFIHLNCQLAGKFAGQVRRQSLNFAQGDLSFGFSDSERFRVQHCSQFQNLTVMVTPDVLCDLAGEEVRAMLSARDEPGFFVRCAGLCRRSIRSANAIASLMVERPRQRLLLHSATLDFLHWHLAAFRHGNDCKALTARECRQLEAAKSLLMQDLSAPPTIAGLARAVGMNQCKLKKGFKHHFGSTIYAMFQEERMSRARQLLQRHNVTETAMMVGYSNVSHFSAAFAKQFGYLPSRARQSVLVSSEWHQALA
ncbi:helix-turn-helix domain-containing protein [Burkholderia guangdongensis]|uniref:helix-turn-helix domain-containing protein n=1 Tax=Burkholderia guangdongensis TaxID=1792500 RepID=UPI0015CD61D4|nr:helix-turn-helix domain-containing protein [Burkholderia guangdongensis]